LNYDYTVSTKELLGLLNKIAAGSIFSWTSRNRMKLGGEAPILATSQGVWPGIQVMDDGDAKAGRI